MAQLMFQEVIKNQTDLLEDSLRKLQITEVEEIKRVCTSYFETKYNEFLNGLNSMEHDVVNPIATLLKNGFVAPNSATLNLDSQYFANELTKNDDTQSKSKKESWNKVSVIKAGTSAALGGFAGSTLSFPWNIIVGGGISAVLLVILSSFVSDEGKQEISRIKQPIYLNKKQAREIIDALEAVAKSIDTLLYNYHLHLDALEKQYKKQVEANSLEGRYKNVLEEMQTISRIALNGRENAFQNIIERIDDFLESEGYKMLSYSDDYSKLFDSKEANVTEITTYKPAIINKTSGEVVLRGTILIPQK